MTFNWFNWVFKVTPRPGNFEQLFGNFDHVITGPVVKTENVPMSDSLVNTHKGFSTPLYFSNTAYSLRAV